MQSFVRRRDGQSGQLERMGKVDVGMYLIAVNDVDVSSDDFKSVLGRLRDLATQAKTLTFQSRRRVDASKESAPAPSTIADDARSTESAPASSSLSSMPSERERSRRVRNLVTNTRCLSESVCIVALISALRPESMVRAVGALERAAAVFSSEPKLSVYTFAAAATETPMVEKLRRLTSTPKCKPDQMQLMLINLPDGKKFVLHPLSREGSIGTWKPELFAPEDIKSFVEDVEAGRIEWQILGESMNPKTNANDRDENEDVDVNVPKEEYEAYRRVFRKMDPRNTGSVSAAHIKALLSRCHLEPTVLRQVILSSRSMKPSVHPQSCAAICRLLRLVAFVQNGGASTAESLASLDATRSLPLARIEGVLEEPSSPQSIAGKYRALFDSLVRAEKGDGEYKQTLSKSGALGLLERSGLVEYEQGRIFELLVSHKPQVSETDELTFEMFNHLLSIVSYAQSGGALDDEKAIETFIADTRDLKIVRLAGIRIS